MKLRLPAISLHPRLSGVLELVVSALFFAVFVRQNSLWAVLPLGVIRLAWWGALVRVTFYPPFIRRFGHFISLIVFGLASTLVVALTHESWVRLLVIVVSVLLTTSSFFLIPPLPDVVPAVGKRERRTRWLMTLGSIGGLWCTTFALSSFQIVTGRLTVLLVIAVTVLTSALGAWWWYMYELRSRFELLLSGGVLSLVMLEVAATLMLLPFGYLTNTFLCTWIWYDVWMILRFYFSKEGIRWEAQRVALGAQAILFIIILVFVVRWH